VPSQAGVGHLRPALKKLGGGMWGRIMCLTGESWRPNPPSPEDVTPMSMVCSPNRPSQLWEIRVLPEQVRESLRHNLPEAVKRPRI
jgi:hypothetical protein